MVTLVLVCFQPTQQCQHHQHHPVCVVVFTTRCHILHMRCTTPLNHLVSVSQTKPFDALAPIPFAINPHQPLCFTASHLATSTHTTVFAPSLCFLHNPKPNHSPFCNHHNPLTIMMSHKVTNKHHTLFPCSCPLLPNPFLFLFSLCHSTTWWWWCMVVCTHNLCVCIPPHQSHPNQTQWCLSCATPHKQKKEKVIIIVFDGKMST